MKNSMLVALVLIAIHFVYALQKTVSEIDGEIQHPLSAISNSLYSNFDVARTVLGRRDVIVGHQPRAVYARHDYGLPASYIFSGAPNVFIPRPRPVVSYVPQPAVRRVVGPQYGFVGGYSYGRPSQGGYIAPVPVQQIVPQRQGYIGGPAYANTKSFYTPQVRHAVKSVVRDQDSFKIMQMQNPIGYRFF